MKASYCTKYGGPEVYRIIDVETPSIKESEVLVQVHYAIVSPTDSNFRSGKPFISRLFSGIFKPRKAIHGEMFVGKVFEVGSNVSDFVVGDMVYGSNGMKLGAYAEFIAVDVKETIKKVPDNISSIDALSLLDGGITALPFLKELAKVKANDEVLINGASGAVGSMGVMIAKHLGAKVTGVCSTQNVDTVYSLGADNVIDYKKENFAERINTYDCIFDAVGKSTFSVCKKALKDNGIYVTTVPTLGVMFQALFQKNSLKKRGSFMAAGLRKPHVKIEDLKYLEALVVSKELKPLIGKQFNLEELGQAQAYVETGHKVGNVTIKLIK